MKYDLEEGQIVLCTVEKIVGTTVFVYIENNGEGTVTTPEIAPGRIRNLRDYVFPGKEIVCKVLSIKGDKIYLSLRRVKQNEKKELLDKINREKSCKAILKTVLGEEAEKAIGKITENHSILEFFEQAKENPKILGEYLTKPDAEKILKILESKKDKPKEIRQIFKLSSNSENGIDIIKNILQSSCRGSQCRILYIAAGKYRLSIIGPDFKHLKTEINSVLDNIEKEAKKQGCEFSSEKN